MAESADVTVVITTYNREKLLGRAIEASWLKPIPMGIGGVDDASTDGTLILLIDIRMTASGIFAIPKIGVRVPR